MGHSSFRLRFKNKMVLITDPFDPDYLGLPFAKQKCDLVTISHNHEDHNDLSNLTGPVIREEMFVINEEGEYEVGGVGVTAIKSYHDKNKGADRGVNLITVIRDEGITICHLGDLGQSLSDRKIEEIGLVDVLLAPVGGRFTINATEAGKVVAGLNPSIVIPMHYKVDGLIGEFGKLDGVGEFLVSSGLEVMTKDVDLIKVDQGSLPENTNIVLLNA